MAVVQWFNPNVYGGSKEDLSSLRGSACIGLEFTSQCFVTAYSVHFDSNQNHHLDMRQYVLQIPEEILSNVTLTDFYVFFVSLKLNSWY